MLQKKASPLFEFQRCLMKWDRIFLKVSTHLADGADIVKNLVFEKAVVSISHTQYKYNHISMGWEHQYTSSDGTVKCNQV